MRRTNLLRMVCQIAGLLLVVACAALPSSAQTETFYGPFAYVTNQSSNTVSVIDTPTNTLVTTVTLPGCDGSCASPAGLAVTPDGSRVYVANKGNGTVSVIATSTNTVSTTITLPTCSEVCLSSPIGVAITPDGTRAYVTDPGYGVVDVIDTNPGDVETYNTVTATITATTIVSPFSIAITPDGAYAYATEFLPPCDCTTPTNVNMISTATNAVVASISVGNDPAGVAVSPNGVSVYVTNYATNTVSVFAADNLSPTITTITVGSGPYSVAFTPNGAFAYVVNQFSNTVSVINTATQTVGAPITPTCEFDHQIAITPNGLEAYVADAECNQADVISTSSNTQTTSVSLLSNYGQFGVAIGGPPTYPAIALLLNPNGGTNDYAFGCPTPTSLPATCAFDEKVVYGPPTPPDSNINLVVQAFAMTQLQLNAFTAGTGFAGATLAPYAGTGGYGIRFVDTCQDATTLATIPCPQFSNPYEVVTNYNGVLPSNVAFLKDEDDGPYLSNILTSASALRTNDPTVVGRTKPVLSGFQVVGGVTGTPPTITLTSPTNTTYNLNQTVLANYACTGTYVLMTYGCVGNVASGAAIDTTSVGTKTFTVTAEVSQGPTAALTVTYTVIAAGPVASVVPSSVSFGNVEVGHLAFGVVTLTNTGNASLNIASVRVASVSGGDSEDFFAFSLCPRTLAVGKSCSIFLLFYADADSFSLESATLTITDNAPGSPQKIPLTATVIKRDDTK
jgi:YVTN family beta-propeller protein